MASNGRKIASSYNLQIYNNIEQEITVLCTINKTVKNTLDLQYCLPVCVNLLTSTNSLTMQYSILVNPRSSNENSYLST